jgi:YD repeat-containing protein
MRDIDRAALKGAVRTVTTERKDAGTVFVEELTFDRDGRLLSLRNLRDGVPRSDLPKQRSPESADFSIKSVPNADGSRTDTQQVIGIDGWSMEGLSVAIGTYGAVVARTTFDNHSIPVETVFLDARNDETAKICYACDERGRILQAIQSLRPGFTSTLAAEAIEGLQALLGPDWVCSRLSFAYDEAGRVTESEIYFMGRQAQHAVTTYNSQGDKETITTNDQGAARFEYEYDPQGNWVRQVAHYPLGGSRVENRVITYY